MADKIAVLRVATILFGLVGAPHIVGAQTTEPIKIGVVLPLTGPATAIGQENLKGIQLAFDQAGNSVAGRPIQLVVADDQNSPNVGLTEVRRLVENEDERRTNRGLESRCSYLHFVGPDGKPLDIKDTRVVRLGREDGASSSVSSGDPCAVDRRTLRVDDCASNCCCNFLAPCRSNHAENSGEQQKDKPDLC